MDEFKGYERQDGRATGEALVIVYKDVEAEVLSLNKATISTRDFESIPYAVFPKEIVNEADRLGKVLVAIDLADLEFLEVYDDITSISVGKCRIIVQDSETNTEDLT